MPAEISFPYTLVAAILRPQGRRGEVLCELLTDFPEKFSERKQLFLLPAADVDSGRTDRAREITLEDFWMPHGKNAGRTVLKFAGCESIDDAEKLAGLAVAIPGDARASLADDEFFLGDLIGCEIADATGVIGQVHDVDTASADNPLLVVKDGDEEILIPLVKNYLVKVDLAGKRIEMKLPDGLLELNRRDENGRDAAAR